MKAFAVKSIVRVNSRQTCEGGDVKVSCRETHCHISWQTCDEGKAKVSCSEVQREDVPRCSQCEGKLYRGAQYECVFDEGNMRVYGSEMRCQGAFGIGSAKARN